DIIDKWLEVRNVGKKDKILVENLLSGGIALPHDQYTLTHVAGRHMNEFQLQVEPVNPGLKTVQQKEFKSNSTAPWFMVGTAETTDVSGPVWFGSVHYSGNWVLQFDKAFGGILQLLGGINFWDTNWTLNPGETFTTPKMSFGYSHTGADRASLNLAGYTKKHVLPARHREELRPVLYNSWEATYYNVNEKQQMALANVAKDIGVELFVVDDGWFKDRTDGRSQSGLGNFDADKDKFPNGLKPLIDHVHGLGMKFGLWVEPENVNPNSDVYRAHPDWIFQFPNRETNKFRKILNLANEDAYKHLLSALTKLLSEHAIDFIKWDQNNLLSDPGWANAPKGLDREARIRHTANVYRLVEELRARFPKVIFETCASGGGRVDLGMFARMDQAWVSDNTDPIDRLFIQHGYLKMLPSNTMVSWVTSMTRNLPVSLDYRFDVSMSGVLGIGADITKWDEQEKEVARKKIDLYKKLRPMVQWGDYHSLLSPFKGNRSALQYVLRDKDEGVVFCYNMAKYLTGSQFNDRKTVNRIRLKHLNPDYYYIIKNVNDEKARDEVYKGDFLMNVGLSWPVKDSAFHSAILHVERKP
ncbi:MAG TPA: alpha-galactosidase, partial [Sphingobacterium sp.]|nr:alpha-galactosidase [Sphingobacterium sp.]